MATDLFEGSEGPVDLFAEEAPVEGLPSWLLGIPEAGVTLLSTAGAHALGGYRGLTDLFTGRGLDEAVESIQRPIEEYTYQPRTEFGQKILEEAGEFGQALSDVSGYYGGKTGEFFGPEGQLVGEAIGQVTPDILGAVLPFTPGGRAIAKSTPEAIDLIGRAIPEPVKRGVSTVTEPVKEVAGRAAERIQDRRYKPLDIISSTNLIIDEVLGGNAAGRMRRMESELNEMQYKFTDDIHAFRDDIGSKIREAGLETEFKKAWHSDRSSRRKVNDVMRKAGVDAETRTNFQDFLKKSLREREGDMRSAYKSFKGRGDDYLPRYVTDPAKLGISTSAFDKYSVLRNKYERKEIDFDEFEREANRIITEGGSADIAGKKTSHAKERKKGEVTEDQLDAYADPWETLEGYFRDTGRSVAERRFLGEGPDLDASLTRWINEQLGDRELTPNQWARLKSALGARFGPEAHKGPNRMMAGLRDVGAASTIGNIMSAMIQTADIMAATGRHGFTPAMRAMTRRGGFNPEDVNIRRIAHDIGNSKSVTGQGVDALLKASGFQYLDRLGKKTHVNAAANKMQGWSNKEIVDKYDGIVPPEAMPAFIRAVRNKDIQNQDYRYALSSEVMEVQPIALSDMPVLYARNPNGRIAYQLMTWAIRFLNTMREDLRKAKRAKDKDKKRQEYYKLARYAGVVGATSAGVNVGREVIKGLLSDDPVTVEEMQEEALFSVLGLMFLNKYNISELAVGDVESFAQGIVTPASIGIVGEIGKDISKGLQGEFDEMKLRWIPYIGPIQKELRER